MTKRDGPSRRRVLDSLEAHYGQRLTPDREYVLMLSTSCDERAHRNEVAERGALASHVWCPFARADRPGGSMFWCPCACHSGPLC